MEGREVAGLRRSEWVLVVLEVLLAIGAIAGGISLMAGVIDLSDATRDLPFGSPELAGATLCLINGALPLVVAVGAVRRRPWALLGHVAVGAALVGWILVQVAFIGLNSPLQPIYLAYGLVILALAGALHRSADRSARPGHPRT